MTTVAKQLPAPAPQQPAPAPIIFLDTNAVHYATLALSFGSLHGFDVVADSSANMKVALQGKGITASDRYLDGARIVRYLNKRFLDSSAEFYYCPLTTLELLCGGLRGEAVKQAANIGVPHRWFSRMEEKEVRTCLEPNGYTQVQTHHANVSSLFDAIGIQLNEQPVDGPVWALAKTLLENVFVDVQDCLVLACAIIAQANELITADSYLHGTVCWTNNPGAAPPELVARFTSVKSAVVSACAAILGWDDPSTVIIPMQKGNADIRHYLNEGNP